MSEVKSYVPKALRLSPQEAVLRGVQFRQTKNVVPSGGKNSYTQSNNQVEFIFSDGEGIDLLNSCVRFNAVLSANSSVASASDFVERVEFYVGQTSVLSTTVSKMRNLVNILMKNELNEDWFKYAGKNLLGWNSYGLNGGAGVPTHNGSRYYSIPLWILHPALQAQNLPVLGEQIRMVLTLGQNKQVLDVRATEADSYTLNDVELLIEQIVYEPDYKRALMSQIASSEGFSIPMIDFDIMKQNHNGSQSVNFTHRNQRSNALSLYIYDGRTDAGRLDMVGGFTANTKSAPTLHSKVGNDTSLLKVFSGNRNFTPLNGVQNVAEMLGQLERCGGGFGKSDSGTVAYEEYTDNLDASGVQFSPIAVSLERTSMEDTEFQVSNRGISAYDPLVDADIQVQMTLGTALSQANDELYSAIVYEKTLVMADGAISIDA